MTTPPVRMRDRLSELPEIERLRLDDEHARNLNVHAPFAELPFYAWLVSHKTPPSSLPNAIRGYFGVKNVRGLLTEEEITVYRTQHRHFGAHYYGREKNDQ
jgi:hypothetical protein